jgi:polysaccharide biosynthesis protein PslH
MRVLALIADRPYPPVSGARVRNFHLWSALQRLGVEVRVVGIDAARRTDPKEAVGPPSVRSEFFKRDRQWLIPRAWNAMLHSHHEWPRSHAMAGRVDEIVAEWHPDVVHAEELRMGFYLPRARVQRADAVHTITLHNVESELQRKLGSAAVAAGRGLANRIHLSSLVKYERRLVSLVDLAFAYSRVDYERYRGLYPDAHWALTRNGSDARCISPASQVSAPKILIVGTMSYAPNISGLYWFLEQVMPRLATGVSVTVAGSGASAELRRRLTRDSVTFIDTPPDLTGLYAEHAISAVPVLEGSGTRGKILEACAHERMVVTTSLGLEGLDLCSAEEGVVVADNAEAFAIELNRWLPAVEERSQIARRGRQAVLDRYDWSVVATELLRQWRQCASR